MKQYLCAWFDDDKSSRDCCVIATSNRPSDVDPCLRRGGRLEREIDVTGSKLDRYKLLVSLLRAQFTGDNRGIKLRGHSVSAEDIHRVADIIADRTGKS